MDLAADSLALVLEGRALPDGSQEPRVAKGRGAGIECPRGARNLPGLVQEGEPFSEEATLFTKELVLQRETSTKEI
ncbi:UNVERIFIED_CONTAM: hypothetical protein K2H54_077603 [Gekko kuhli]